MDFDFTALPATDRYRLLTTMTSTGRSRWSDGVRSVGCVLFG